ncbi:MAG: hypothetical protein JNK02_02395 [Planctomycetes bacterium]|nr:hypothetical protein [Planctomycetota bacterium]
MNRLIALFVALAMLLAHALAIHDDGAGRFAFPYDQAYAALRLARNLVYDGQLAWNPGSPAFESYPSMLWVAVCAAAERVGPALGLSTNFLVQSAGIVCALGAITVLSRFRADRTASLIAPLFLAASGAFAAAAASGLEHAPFACLAAAAFLALERGRSAWFGGLAALSVLAHPLGIALILGMGAVRAFGRPNDDEGAPRVVQWTAFAAPIGTFAGVALLRHAATGFVLPPEIHALLQPAPGQWREGAASLRDFALVGVIPLLLVFPAAWLVLGSLSRTGAHAVFLALVWLGVAAAAGRSPLPFHVAFAPALPFVVLAVQEGMIVALDGVSRLRRRVTLTVFGAALLGAALASRTPADLGPLPLQGLHEAWVRPRTPAQFDVEQPLGRGGLVEEIALARRLRKAGIYLREEAEPGAAVLTPWPGSIGYLSRITVHDLLARTDPADVNDRPNPWSRRVRADVVRALARDTDFVVPFAARRAEPPSPRDVARAWLEGLDAYPHEAGRLEAIERALAAYELVTVPIEDYTREGESLGRESFLLLRNLRLGARPELAIRVEDDHLRVGLRRTRTPQLVELEIRLHDDAERAWTLRPTGELDPTCRARARIGLLIYDSGTREIELCRVGLPAHPTGGRWMRATARLLNPGSAGAGGVWEAVSDRATLQF